MFKIHLKQPRFTYSACKPFKKKKIQTFNETGNLIYLSKQTRQSLLSR